jgi:hypothetical protein
MELSLKTHIIVVSEAYRDFVSSELSEATKVERAFLLGENGEHWFSSPLSTSLFEREPEYDSDTMPEDSPLVDLELAS